MSASHQSLVRQQFERQFAHYLSSSPMADRTVIEAILAAAPVQPGQRVLDVACGAGFLMRAYAELDAEVFGVDLSGAMLLSARGTLRPSVPADHLIVGDADGLPFDCETFDIVTCKLAFHYFAQPHREVAEMARVCRRVGLVVVIDRVACDDPVRCAAQDRLEKLRTPNKIKAYCESELVELLESNGLTMLRRKMVIQATVFADWMAAAGASNRLEVVRSRLLGPSGEDLTGLAPQGDNDPLMIHHRTLILVATTSGGNLRADQ